MFCLVCKIIVQREDSFSKQCSTFCYAFTALKLTLMREKKEVVVNIGEHIGLQTACLLDEIEVVKQLPSLNITKWIVPVPKNQHPCCYCHGEFGNWTGKEVLRTLGKIRECHRRYVADGSVKRRAQEYFNCINAPLLSGRVCQN